MTEKKETAAVRFLVDYEVDNEHKGTKQAEVYKAGKVYPDMDPGSANHFVSRGIAVPVKKQGKKGFVATDGDAQLGLAPPEAGPPRQDALKHAIRQLDPRKKGHYTDKGKPAPEALAKVLGWEPKAEEIDAAFDVVLSEGGIDLPTGD